MPIVKKTSPKKKGGVVNLAPLISAAFLAAVKIGLEESKKKKSNLKSRPTRPRGK
jgi:hypothetical protein